MTAEGMVHGGINDDRGYRLSLQWQWRQWMVAFEESFEPTNYPWFTSLDEVDPLHLARNGGEAGVADPLAYLSVLPEENNRAVFVSRSMDAWHFDFSRHARDLPGGGDHWKVDVLVKPVGFLGTYRRSRITGLWFCARHQVHVSGNVI
ncbi:MAG: hypothetical protein H7288_24225 [Kineosporiaceae bacterium]|nr:hypothetical protein [Aeromicrobium sp.]